MNPRNVWGRDIATPLSTLQAELHRLYEHYKHAGGIGPGPGPGAGAGAEPSAAWTPAVDLYETPEEIGILIDLPGVDPELVELAVAGRSLTLRGEKPRDAVPEPQGRTLERPHGPFLREVELPGEVDIDAVRAEARHGVITIHLPKVAAARTRTIPIRGGE